MATVNNPNAQPSDTQPVEADEQPTDFTGTPTESNSGNYQDILVGCNSLVEQYRKGEIAKATVYVEIQSKLAEALGNDRTRSDAAFGLFIVTIESHDTEVGAAAGKGRAVVPMQCSPALLYRFQTGTGQMKSLSPRRSKSMSWPMHGYQIDEISEPYCETLSPKLSSSLRSTPSTPK